MFVFGIGKRSCIGEVFVRFCMFFFFFSYFDVVGNSDWVRWKVFVRFGVDRNVLKNIFIVIVVWSLF